MIKQTGQEQIAMMCKQLLPTKGLSLVTTATSYILWLSMTVKITGNTVCKSLKMTKRKQAWKTFSVL